MDNLKLNRKGLVGNTRTGELVPFITSYIKLDIHIFHAYIQILSFVNAIIVRGNIINLLQKINIQKYHRKMTEGSVTNLRPIKMNCYACMYCAP